MIHRQAGLQGVRFYELGAPTLPGVHHSKTFAGRSTRKIATGINTGKLSAGIRDRMLGCQLAKNLTGGMKAMSRADRLYHV